MRILLNLFVLLTSILAWSQPDTDIFLFRIDQETIPAPTNISDNSGYDNQPSFWSDSQSILYARNTDGQTEIARYFISTGETVIITQTKQGSEYSPIQIPDTDEISSIRLDTTGLQLLYRYDLKGNSTILVEGLKIGYHAWISSNSLGASVLGNPHELLLLDLNSGSTKQLITNPGRSLHKVGPFNGFSYVDKNQEPGKIFLYSPAKDFKDYLIDLPVGVEDYCWSADYYKIYTSNRSQILVSIEGMEWQNFIELSEYGIDGSISRMSASPDGKWLAVVIDQKTQK